MSDVESAPGRVVVVGSINVDLVIRSRRLPGPGETVTGGTFGRFQGGKGANQAVAAARAGGSVAILGAVGEGGEEPLTALAEAGIATETVQRIPGEWTGHAFIVVDEDGENQIAVASGANHQLTAGHVHSSLGGLGLTRSDVVVLCFELLDPPLIAAAELAASTAARLVVNPAPARRADALLARGAVWTPNRLELAELVGLGVEGEAEVRAASVELARRTGGAAVTTLGADGALLADGEVVERIPAWSVDATDATGAGDTFTGVLATALACGQSLRDSVDRAMAAAALATTAPGAREAMPTSAQIDAFLAAAAS